MSLYAVNVFVASPPQESASFSSDTLILTALARCCLLRRTGVPEGVRVERSGKPVFAPDIGVHFSVSHSGKHWCCAFSPFPVGLDIEAPPFRRESLEKIARRFFHPKELKWLESQGFSDFYKVWTAKESAVKFSGDGIRGDFDGFHVADETGLLSQISLKNTSSPVTLRHISDIPGVYMCVCGVGDFHVCLHRFQT